MGHVRLGELPRTRKWTQVVGLLAGGAGAAQVANATIAAADRGLSHASDDKGLIEALWLLMQLPLAAREDNFARALHERGLDVPDEPSLMDVVAAVSDAVDVRLANNKGRTDLGEMAQMAAAETITEAVGPRTQGLFGTTAADVRAALAGMATVKQFGSLTRTFFSRLTNKCLEYFLSRAWSNHVGEGLRFTTLAQHAEFSAALQTHCSEAARIVEKFAGEWYSKTNWERGGIARQDAASFAHVAMRKLTAELQQGARHHVP